MEKIHLVARFNIHQGQLDAFKVLMEKCIALTKTEPGALLYDWFVDESQLLCTVVETYMDSNAALAHAGNVNEELGKLMEISDFSAEVFGNASNDLQNALNEMGIKPVPYSGGLS